MQPNIHAIQAVHHCHLGTPACARARCILLVVKTVNQPASAPEHAGHCMIQTFLTPPGLRLHDYHAPGAVQGGAAISRNTWINTDL